MTVCFFASGFCCEGISVTEQTTAAQILQGDVSFSSVGQAESHSVDHHQCETHCFHFSAIQPATSLVIAEPPLESPCGFYRFSYAEPCVDTLKRPPVLV